MNPRAVWAVAKAQFREFWRTPEAVFWTYGFPLVMTVVLGFAFGPKPPDPVPIAVVVADPAAADSDPLVAVLRHDARLSVEVLDAAAADRALVRGRVGLLVHGSVAEPVVRADPTRPEAQLAGLVVARALRDARDGPGVAIAQEVEDRPGSRYIDFLVPGLIGLNLLGAGMWGFGFNLVQMRTQNLLRRLSVTPLTRGEFLLGYLMGRFVLVIPEAIVIALFGVLLWGVPFRGSWLAFLLVVAVGGFAFAGLGCLLASRARTTEGVAGLMNLCQLPMWMLGGVFFANENLRGPMRWAAEALPLTHINRALRDVMLEPGSVLDIAVPLAGLGLFAALCFGLGLRLFRWQ
ncbi:MAG: ABC transporter permease [Planctomycetes bacterium]|nr:ABC transporter permease [Planctomycetota bacterium]